MCTTKQADFIEKLAIWKDQKVDLVEVNKMGADEASKLIDKLMAMESVKNGNSKQVEPERRPLFNELRFGMCCKIVCNKYTMSEIFGSRERIQMEIDHLYQIVSQTEAEVNSALFDFAVGRGK